MTPAGFWRRYAAWSLDAAIVAVPTALLLWRHLAGGGAAVAADYAAFLQGMVRGMTEAAAVGAPPAELAWSWLSDPALRQALGALRHDLFALLWPPILLFALLGALYRMGLEASARQATPGQRALRLQIADASGLRIGALRALGRHFAGALSWLTLNLGHAMAALPPRRLALHDRLSNTRVLQRGGHALPAWAAWWMAAQAVALLLLTAAFFLATNAIFDAAIDSALG
ncbi:RDD family protein [Luteimonas aquatica]|uniref:RDD family protein n=1 Tax=Luteimonas aquatica TaxID=450364 RepID=UPI001F585729|nr:RDD family protein [Luteimonas aquatica]